MSWSDINEIITRKKSMTRTTCSQCGKLCQPLRCYINSKNGQIWCEFCLGKEKNRRNQSSIHKRWNQIN